MFVGYSGNIVVSGIDECFASTVALLYDQHTDLGHAVSTGYGFGDTKCVVIDDADAETFVRGLVHFSALNAAAQSICPTVGQLHNNVNRRSRLANLEFSDYIATMLRNLVASPTFDRLPDATALPILSSVHTHSTRRMLPHWYAPKVVV